MWIVKQFVFSWYSFNHIYSWYATLIAQAIDNIFLIVNYHILCKKTSWPTFLLYLFPFPSHQPMHRLSDASAQCNYCHFCINQIVSAVIIVLTKWSPLSSLHQRKCHQCHYCINKIVINVIIASTKLSLLEYLAIITFLFFHSHIVIHHLHRPPEGSLRCDI